MKLIKFCQLQGRIPNRDLPQRGVKPEVDTILEMSILKINAINKIFFLKMQRFLRNL